MEGDVLDGKQEFPERLRHFGVLAQRRQQEVNREHDEIGRHDPQGATGEEAAEVDAPIVGERREKLAANQITTENEEKIETGLALAILKPRINCESQWRCRFTHNSTKQEIEVTKYKAPKIKKSLSGTETGWSTMHES